MNYYCENCGSKLDSNQKFCDNCGHPVSVEMNQTDGISKSISKENFDLDKMFTKSSDLHDFKGLMDVNPLTVFAGKDWEKKWKKVAKKFDNVNLGIILTNTLDLPNRESFIKIVGDYILFKQKQGIYYYLLDLNDQSVAKNRAFDCNSTVELLKEIYSCSKPKYLLIVGDNMAVGSIKWDNPSYVSLLDTIYNPDAHGDSDVFVDSDLPYVTLDAGNPKDGRAWSKFKFDGAIRVGRIPCRRKSNFLEAYIYFNNVMDVEKINTIHPFAFSTVSWKETSQASVSGVCNTINTSPRLTYSDFLNGGLNALSGGDPNLLYFNLHGAQGSSCWYGEDETRTSQPIAFHPECLPKSDCYVIGTEACYGANPNDDNSMLNSAIKSGCLAFLGSQQIAWGSGGGYRSCADILVGEFIKKVAAGYSVGDSYIYGLKMLVEGKKEFNDTELKTLAEFGLYGDPSECLVAARNKMAAKSIFDKGDSFDKGLHILMPNVREAVGLMLANVNERIMAKVTDFVNSNHKEYLGITPTVYKVQGYGGYQAAYCAKNDKYVNVLKVYFDENGNIDKVYVSK